MATTESLASRRRSALQAFIDSRGARQLNAICTRAGVSESAVRGFLKGKSRSLNQETYDKLAQSEGVPVALLLGEVEPTERPAIKGRGLTDHALGREHKPLDWRAERPKSDSLSALSTWKSRVVRVQAWVQAGNYRESNELPGDEIYEVSVPVDPVYSKFQLIGLEVLGKSMDLVYPEGTALVCVSVFDLGEAWMPEPGDRVIVLRLDRNGLAEHTVKEYAIDETGQPWLLPRTSDPSLQQPVAFTPPIEQDDEGARIIGLVVGSYRPERRGSRGR